MMTFPVLLVNAPFVYYKTKGAGGVPQGKYPGDPTPLLYATNLAIREGKKRLSETYRYMPDFSSGVYNPVIWNPQVAEKFERDIRTLKPAVVALSGTSPSWPFANEMMRIVRQHSNALIVAGGPHMDEMWTAQGLHPAHPLITTPQLFDIAVSGDGHHPFLFLIEALCQYLEQTRGALDRQDFKNFLAEKSRDAEKLPGKALICFRAVGELAQIRTSGKPLALADYGSPYEHRPPLAQFPIFENELTAHVMSTFGCTFNCAFCSERGNLLFERSNVVNHAISQIRTARKWGTKHFFFDDSVLMAGAWDTIERFADELLTSRWNIKWAGQLTVHNLTPKGMFTDPKYGKFTEAEIRRTLMKMHKSGFSYLYIGLESAAESVMRNIDKAKRLNGRWQASVEAALRLVKATAGCQIGTSIMFGNQGETDETINETIDFVEYLVKAKLLDYVSMNLATYHPNTPLALADGVAKDLRYHGTPAHPGVLYELFEEADPGRISKRMSEERMLQVLNQVPQAWGTTLTSNGRVKQVLGYGYPSLQFCEV